jgi:hypothetical protein
LSAGSAFEGDIRKVRYAAHSVASFVMAGHSRPKDGVASARLMSGHRRLVSSTRDRA